MDNTPRAGILVSATPARPQIAPVGRLVSGPAAPALLPKHPGERQRWRRLVPAWIVSGVFHALLIGLFLAIGVGADAPKSSMERAIVETKVEDEPRSENLVNDDIGLDPEVPTNFDVTRIEDISVPGPVNKDDPVGILNAPPEPPMTLPPPVGFGRDGQGGSPLGPKPGRGGNIGLPGGLGGLKLVPGGFGGRGGATRERMVREGGGNGESEAAVARGLKWLIGHQAPDGSWSLSHYNIHAKCKCTGRGRNDPIAGTALGLLPFLGAGHTHQGGLAQDTPYAKNIERGLKFLMLQERKGAFNGDMYTQGLATIVLCEAYGLTSDPVLQKPAQRALLHIVRAQNTKGGWDYRPGGPTPDTSIGGWQIMALKSGQLAGLEVPTQTLAQANTWLDEWAGDREGSIYGYREAAAADSKDAGEMRKANHAIGLLCRMYLGWGPRRPGLVKGAKWLLRPSNLPRRDHRGNMYFNYYATQVMHHLGGDSWTQWNSAMRDHLIRTQDQGLTVPHQKGSWGARGDFWATQGGRITMTSLCLLTLEVYYRHLPLYRREMGGNK